MDEELQNIAQQDRDGIDANGGRRDQRNPME